MQKKLWIVLSCLSAFLSAEVPCGNSEQVELKCSKCKTFKNLTVCNDLKTTNLNVTNSETVAGILTAANLVLNDPTIALSSGGNLLDYGYFYSENTGAMSGVLLTESLSTDAYTAIASGACGITVANAGTYFVWLYIWGPDNSAWTINVNNVAVTGATFSNSFPPDDTFSPATGFAIVNVPASGQTITITGDNLAEPQGGVTVNLGIIRLQ